MPLISAADIAGMIADLGDVVTIGGATAYGVFYEPGKQYQQFDGSFTTTGPILVVDAAAASGITASTVIMINNVEYRAINSQPDRAGWYAVTLTRDF